MPWYCTGYKKTARYYTLNILEELDSKEEVCTNVITDLTHYYACFKCTIIMQYYVDRGSGILYLFAVPQEDVG